MNKVEKIKNGIERLKESLPWGSCASQISMECNCKNEAYNEVLSYIDSLSDVMKFYGRIYYNKEAIAGLAVELADALIEELKK